MSPQDLGRMGHRAGWACQRADAPTSILGPASSWSLEVFSWVLAEAEE